MLVLPLLFLAVQFESQQPTVANRQPQLAVSGDTTAVVFGAGNTIYFAASRDAGASWTKPVVVSKTGVLSLGMRRGPRIVLDGKAIVVAAIVGEKGRGADGDLIAWRSTDGGKSWDSGRKVNGAAGSAREGLHAMATNGKGLVFATWLDLRSKGTRLYGSVSADGGATWSENRLVYESPEGSVCECCHPSAVVDERGRVTVMFRNALEGNRDLYVVQSADGGRTFGAAQKLGSGSWRLNACPMDGGGVALSADGTLTAAWRREGTVYRSSIGGEEVALGPGRQPVVAASRRGTVLAWTEGKVLRWTRSGEKRIATLAGEAAFPSLAALPNGDILIAGEREGGVFVEVLR